MTKVPYALLPYQQRWLADRSRVKMFTKSRRIGISWTEASDSTLIASKANGMDTTYICYDKDITVQFINDCADWARAYDLAASAIQEGMEVFADGDEDKACSTYTIEFDSGWSIVAIAGTPRKLRGRKGRVIIDEAAFLTNFSAVFEAALALMIWGGEIRIITTYNGVEEPYFELEQEVIAGKFNYSRHFCTFRQAVAEGLYQRICLVSGQEWSPQSEKKWVKEIYDDFGPRASQELDCIPAQASGRYIPRIVVEQCMSKDIPVIRWEFKDDFATKSEEFRTKYLDELIERDLAPLLAKANPNLKSYLGEDFGRTGDFTGILPAQEQLDLTRQALFLLEIRNCPYEQQRQVVFYICDRLPRFMGAAFDARGNGDYLSEVAMQRYTEHRIHRIKATQQFYLEWMPQYKAAFEDRKISLPQDSDVLSDHGAIVVERGIPHIPDSKNTGTDGKPRHGDSAIAGLMLWYASCNGGAPFEFELGKEREDQAIADYGNYSFRGYL